MEVEVGSWKSKLGRGSQSQVAGVVLDGKIDRAEQVGVIFGGTSLEFGQVKEIESHRVLGNGFWVDHVHRATSWSGSRNKSKKIKSHSGVPNKKIESHRLSLPILEESELNFSPKFNFCTIHFFDHFNP